MRRLAGIVWRRKKPPSALELLQAPFTCASCGAEHRGPFDLSVGAPDFWRGPSEPEPHHALRMDGDFLSTELCVIDGEHFFIRGLLEIPVHGLSTGFAFGCWSSLSRANFRLCLDNWDEPGLEELGPWPSWFANSLKPSPDSLNQPCTVYPQAAGTRPWIVLEDLDHPLARAGEYGITPDELVAIYRAHGHGPDTATV